MEEKVFLGGTCNNSTWRDELIPKLKIKYFNPVVNDWTPECQEEEERQKNEECTIHLYVITPKMKGVFSIAEVVESAIDKHDRCIFCYIDKDGEDEFDKAQKKSLDAVGNMVTKHGAIWCIDFNKLADILNNYY